MQYEKTVFYPGLSVGNCCDWFYPVCFGTSGVVLPVECSYYLYTLRGVCGHCSAVVCAGILEKDGQKVFPGGYIGTGGDLFSGAVHSHCFSRGRIQLVSAAGTGTELYGIVSEYSPEESVAAMESILIYSCF